MSDLSPRQQRFVQEFIVDLNATQAALRAGYSEESARQIGSQNLSKPYIQDAISKAMAERSSRTKINADWVLKRLVRNVKRASTSVPVTDREGNPTGEYVYEGNVVNRALELIGKHVGMFTDKLKLSGSVGGWDLSKLTDDEISVLARIAARATGNDSLGDDPAEVEEAAATVPMAEGAKS